MKKTKKENLKQGKLYLSRHELLSEKDLGAALAVNENHPLWVAVNQMLHDYIRDAIDKSRNPGMVNNFGSMASNSGELDALCSFYEELHERRNIALKMQTVDEGGSRVATHEK